MKHSPRLFYCNTVRRDSVVSDINPLILRRYKFERILVLCARQSQLARVSKLDLDNVLCVGWWDMPDVGLVDGMTGLLDEELIMSFKTIVILDKDRISPLFNNLISSIESLCMGI